MLNYQRVSNNPSLHLRFCFSIFVFPNVKVSFQGAAHLLQRAAVLQHL